MKPTTNVDPLTDFFAASAGVAGALIGLLFVAISVSQDRLRSSDRAHLHRVRASAALTAFLNALTVSLFALVSVDNIGKTAVVASLVGLLFVAAALLSLVRAPTRRWRDALEAVFLVGLAVTFVFQLVAGRSLADVPPDTDTVQTIATLVIVCFLIGVARAWELIGGPAIGMTEELLALFQRRAKPSESGEAPTPGAGGSR